MDELKPTANELQALERFGSSFDNAIEAEEACARRRRRTMRTAPVFISAVAVSGIALLATGMNDRPAERSDFAAKPKPGVLELAAVQDAPREDQYSHTSSTTLTVTPAGHRLELVRARTEAWLSQSMPGWVKSRQRITDHAPRRVSHASLIPISPSSYNLGERTYTAAQVKAYTAKPNELTDRLRGDAAALPTGQRSRHRWNAIVTALRATSHPLPGPINAALIAELGRIDGVSIDRSARSSGGEAGHRYRLEREGLAHSAFFSLRTARLLETQTRATVDGAASYDTVRAGDLIDTYRLEESEILDSLPPALAQHDDTD
ncbi:MAG: hypothetical protein QM648_06500 [Solirubrobacterales bacterium]